jgi:hypothetical protein
VVKGSVAASIAATEPREIAAGTLLVLVRPTDYVQKQLFRPGDTGAPLPILSRPIAGDLVEIVAADQLLAYRFPPGPELRAALRTDDAGVWALTLANLRDTLADPDLTSRQVVTLHTGGLASSYLAEPELWDSPPMQVGGAPVVAPIGRDLVLVTHERDAKGIADMRKQAREMQRDPEALSDRLFVRRYGAWIELDPPPDRTRRR